MPEKEWDQAKKETKEQLETENETEQVAQEAMGNWYVVHTYSGYENKVKATIEKTIERRGLEHLIFDIRVPMEENIEMKDGRRKSTMKKIFPGYILVKMIVTDESWYVIRNTRGVTGFVGPGSEPIPLSDEEVVKLGVEDIRINLDVEAGDNIRVISGPLANFIGVIEEVMPEQQKVRVLVSMFGRETPIELNYGQIQKI
jgi:transcriptional antiterminator NusG